MALPHDEKLALLADRDRPPRAERAWPSRPRARRAASPTGRSSLSPRCSPPRIKQYDGREVGEIAATEGKEPWDVVCDIAVADDLRTIFTPPDRGPDDESWKRRVEVWRDPRAIVGASDAGAHLDFLATFNYCDDDARRRPCASGGCSRSRKRSHCSRMRRPGSTG